MIYTNEQLNRMAAGVLGEECWHVLSDEQPDECVKLNCVDDRHRRCKFCNKLFALLYELELQPDYCNDRNHAVRVAEAVDVEKLGRAIEILEGHRCCNTPNWGDKVERYGWITDFATLPAKTLLLAAFVAHGIMPMDEAKENL